MKRMLVCGWILILFIVCSNKGLFAQTESEEFEEDISLLEQEENRINISGFMTFQYQEFDIKSEDNTLKDMINDKSHFRLNNFNLYFLFNVNDDLLAFSEIRYLFAPTGVEQQTSVDASGDAYHGEDARAINYILQTPYKNSVIDNQNTNFKYGSIYIERAYIEWNRLSFANLRFGRYITPFGIWSQDHGDPALTSMRVPMMVNAPYYSLGMPQWQTGIELLGKISISSLDMIVDYAGYVGNGVSDSDAILDEEDSNKAAGAFINFKLPTIGRMLDIEIGCSGYYGERTYLYSQQLDPVVIVSTDMTTQTGNFDLDVANNKYYNKQKDSIATAHIKIVMRSLPLDGTLVLQAEGLRQWVDEDGANIEFDPGNMRWVWAESGTRYVDMAGQPRNPEDYTYDAYYAQAEYQFFGRITPYYRYEGFKIGMKKEPQIKIRLSEVKFHTIGLNLKPYPRLVVKAEWGRLMVSTPGEWQKRDVATFQPIGEPFKINNDIETYQASVTLSF